MPVITTEQWLQIEQVRLQEIEEKERQKKEKQKVREEKKKENEEKKKEREAQREQKKKENEEKKSLQRKRKSLSTIPNCKSSTSIEEENEEDVDDVLPIEILEKKSKNDH